MSPKKEYRNEEDLHVALGMVLKSVNMRMKGVDHNIIYVVSDPGAGKTMMGRDIVTKNGGFLKAYSPALERLEKFGGIPDIIKVKNSEEEEELHTKWSVPQMITEINELASKHPYVVVMLDDWHLCIDELQQIGFELFTYYSLNGYKVKSNVTFMLAGNETSAAGAKLQLSPIRNRCTLIYAKPNVDYWINNYAQPNNIHPSAVSFFKDKSNQQYFQEPESTSEQFGSPRSWASASNWLKEIETDKNYSDGDKTRLLYSILFGSVSPKAAEKFMQHYEIFRNIDLEKIFKHGDVTIPTDNIERFCFCSAVNSKFFNLFYIANEKKDINRKIEFSKIYKQCLLGMKDKYPELAVMMGKDLGKMGSSKWSGGLTGKTILTFLFQKEILTTDEFSWLIEVGNVAREDG